MKKIIQKHTKTAKEAAKEFRKEFRKQLIVAITAAFAFLIALVWRTPIENLIGKMNIWLGLALDNIYSQIISAIIVTCIGVGILIVLSKWEARED